MTSLGFPDWKKIGWRVGKKLRDILNPPTDHGPSKEERRAQRLGDILKGFAYFDDFDELNAFTPGNVDPVQKANTPLLVRSEAGVHDGSFPNTRVLLCHDYHGGYHDYESVRPIALEHEPYSCNYLQYVEIFVYFSHKLACVPPPSWTNTMHRNGVKSLGTFIVEPGTADIEKMLALVDGEYIVAKQLASMTHAFGFDGWLLNIEKEFLKPTEEVFERLSGFIRRLKHLLGDEMKVIWYDALNIENKVDYQNGLTAKNQDFARSADALFTNYKWNKVRLQEARIAAGIYGIKTTDIFFGIDVWAQNTNMPGPPRVTYPPQGGGGTNTGVAVHTLATEGFSTAIFGPAWTYEHFPTSALVDPLHGYKISLAKAVDMSMWEGSDLPEELNCDCHGEGTHHTNDYRPNPIVNHACEFPAGTASFLETNFIRAFERKEAEGSDGCRQIHSVLGSQDILPQHLLPMSIAEWKQLAQGPLIRVLYAHIDDHCSGLSISMKSVGCNRDGVSPSAIAHQQSISHTESTTRLCLFKLNMAADGTLYATVDFIMERGGRSINIGFFAAYKGGDGRRLDYSYSGTLTNTLNEPQSLETVLRYPNDKARLVEFGVYCIGPIEQSETLPILRISRISIKPLDEEARYNFLVEHLCVIDRGQVPHVEKRLSWKWRQVYGSWPLDLPWSKTTGPFSHFKITMGGREIGKAYCLEFPLLPEDCKFSEETSDGVEVHITGWMFGGGSVTSLPTFILKSNLGLHH